MENSISRNNHYVAKMYLSAWKNSKKEVYVYDLLVPNVKVPFWKSKAIKSIGSEDNFYISLKNKSESDDIEKWFNEKYETPASISLKKAINEDRLSRDDWGTLIDFVACHIVRTPAFLIKLLNGSKDKYEPIFNETIQKISNELKNITKEQLNERIKINKRENSTKFFPIKITDTKQNDNNGNRLVKIETILGKQFYFFAINHLLDSTVKVLHKHKWGIMEIDDKVILPTSDDPVICLNYNDYENYDFGGGWGNKNSNIIFPISPNKVLWTQVGVKCPPRMKINYDFSLFLRKIIIEHSHRKVFSNIEISNINKMKKRKVSEEEYKREKEMWINFHKDYLEKESQYIKE